MVVRVNGAPRQGVWFSADVRFISLTVTNATFLADLTVLATTGDRQADVIGSGLEVVLEALATVGTVIGLSVVAADTTSLEAIVDYAQALSSDGTTIGNQAASTVIADVTALIDAHEAATSETGLDLTVTNFGVSEGFAGAAIGVAV